ncbi:beta-aspartyl-peptidase [Clostridium sp. 'deep sea']|uniref:beta-aspartyl-peptidase n=1 Tax=Clostridium sp. 'deep sea' TaxID=2779445 RepID=UPI0018964E1E|nr:beta-aspartyl-peptidase [Clostridium sp. 'deep sea']QOR35734.1 beta-aspartyl-peptidase [Clostridium sp. 'deep sea']
MIKLIKKVKVYSPEYLGVKDILVCDKRIAQISDEINIDCFENKQIIDGSGLIAVPGFMDGHVHMIGGGGEGGPKTRTPELMLSKITTAGVTTVVGCLGTDGITRHMSSLLAKAQALEEEGITTFIYTGSYEVPTTTITNSVKEDLILIKKVIGVGEIAISDHRSSQPSYHEIKKLAAETRVGGMLGGKPGIVHFHVGSEKAGIDYIFKMLEETDIPVTQFLPTHMGRTQHLVEQGLELIKLGGKIDITAGAKAAQHVNYLLENGANIKGITLSSDGNGSLPKFDDKGNLIGLKAADMKTVHTVWKTLITEYNVDITDALHFVSTNVANNLNLNDKKGVLKVGSDADILLMNDKFDIIKVFARGTQMVENGKPIKFGTFE